MAKKKKILRPYYCKECGALTGSTDRSRDICYEKKCEESWAENQKIRRKFSSAPYGGGTISGATLVG